MNNQENKLELTVVMPCLNEADTLEVCISKALDSFKRHNLSAEVVVADNGSTDGSLEIAERCGARIVHVSEKGYGNALMGGIEAAYGKFVIMGDADDSYDFSNIYHFVEKLREGYDLVMGCRLPRGGGSIIPGAMPITHRLFGNPMFSFLARRMFKVPTSDVYCGLRGFTRKFYDELELRCTGMEFATEMIIKASLYRRKIGEVPITLHKDGRISHPPHLNTLRDGWRTLRFFLIYSPRWLFMAPGVAMFLIGFALFAWLLPGTRQINNISFDIHSMLIGALGCIIGYQLITFAYFTKLFAINEKLIPEDPKFLKAFSFIDIKSGLF